MTVKLPVKRGGAVRVGFNHPSTNDERARVAD
jgi:hypothetical protein